MQSPSFLLRVSLLLLRVLQWASAVIVMGIASYFIAQYSGVGLVIYHEVIVRPSIATKATITNIPQAVLSVAFFLPGLISPFMPKFGFVSLAIDMIFSYLYASPSTSIPTLSTNIYSSWLTSFILMSRDYLGNRCAFAAPYGGKCSLKRTNQAFAFIALYVHHQLLPYSMLMCTSLASAPSSPPPSKCAIFGFIARRPTAGSTRRRSRGSLLIPV